MANDTNRSKWPNVVSQDVIHHIGTLKGEVFMFSGQVKGKTLLPLPHQADLVAKAIESESRYNIIIANHSYHTLLLHALCNLPA